MTFNIEKEHKRWDEDLVDEFSSAGDPEDRFKIEMSVDDIRKLGSYKPYKKPENPLNRPTGTPVQ